MDTTGAFVLTKIGSAGKTVNPPEGGYTAKSKRRAAAIATTAEYDDDAEYHSSSA